MSCSVPGKVLTGNYGCISMYSIVDGEPQGYCILATLCIGEDIVTVTSSSISNTIPVPGKGLTGGYQCIGMNTVVDGEPQRYGILTTLCIAEDIVTVAAAGISNAVAVPGKGLAGGYQCIGMNAVVDGEPQCYGIRTALRIGEDVINILC